MCVGGGVGERENEKQGWWYVQTKRREITGREPHAHSHAEVMSRRRESSPFITSFLCTFYWSHFLLYATFLSLSLGDLPWTWNDFSQLTFLISVARGDL